ncbi:MAG: endo-1,4-beta-xylanase [Clostridia bacterium]|nr:endo-1,4-beta-xylanase [Clostridia bacterium]
MSRYDTALKYFNEQREETEARIKNGIEQYRKGRAKITVKGADGKPVSGAKIKAVHKKHEFKFGANIFMLDEFENEEKNGIYREKFPELFNLATLPFYWKTLETPKGVYRFGKDSCKIYRRPAIDLCIEYCTQKGIEPKAHCLNYDFFRPAWLKDAEIDEHKKALEEHFRILAERYADVIPSWEVTNETFNETFAREAFLDKYYSRFYRQKDFNEWSFRTADKYFPNNHLIINDHLDFGCMRSLHGEFFGQRSPYYMEIERMQSYGVHHLDAIGFQYHCFFKKELESELAVTRYNPGHIFDVLDTYALLGKKLQITEMTVSAFGGEAEDEEVQAELMRNLYSVFFCHPAMEAIVYWNVVDGYASGGKPGDMSLGENVYYGALCRFDMSEKPAYKVLRKLIREEWHTEAETVTDEYGKASFRGFYGDYDAEIIYDGRVYTKPIKLSAYKKNEIEIELQ